MQTTSPGCTSSETPFRTSSRPYRLRTASALTIGALIVALPMPREAAPTLAGA
jgi:hypothetical protein